MKITVYHQKFNQLTGAVEGYVPVAAVEINDAEDLTGALEYAWRWTNNVGGSWSLKDEKEFFYDGICYDNEDLNDAVTVIADLPTDSNGKVLGLRSSMVGDRFVIDDDTSYCHEVASFGFNRVSFPKGFDWINQPNPSARYI